MSHFAKVVNGKVVEVIVAEADFFDTFVDTTPGKWIQTSYNTFGGQHKLGGTPLRKNYAGIGWNYDKEADAFYGPKPYDSWTLNTTTYLWDPPTSYPNDGRIYEWDEENKNWKDLAPGTATPVGCLLYTSPSPRDRG